MVCTLHLIRFCRCFIIWLVALGAVLSPLSAYSVDSFLSILENEGIEEVREYFDKINLTIDDIPNFSSFFDHLINEIHYRYGIEISLDEVFKQSLLLIESQGIPYEERLIVRMIFEEILLSSNKPILNIKMRQGEQPEKEEIPGSIIVGAIETAAGGLFCLVPIPGFQALGVLLTGDGIRRTLDGVEEMDKNKQTSFLGDLTNEPKIVLNMQ